MEKLVQAPPVEWPTITVGTHLLQVVVDGGVLYRLSRAKIDLMHLTNHPDSLATVCDAFSICVARNLTDKCEPSTDGEFWAKQLKPLSQLKQMREAIEAAFVASKLGPVTTQAATAPAIEAKPN